jgi:hypothetical protein
MRKNGPHCKKLQKVYTMTENCLSLFLEQTYCQEYVLPSHPKEIRRSRNIGPWDFESWTRERKRCVLSVGRLSNAWGGS